MLIGNVGKNPEIRYIENGVCTAQVSLATTTKGYVLPNGTQIPDRTEWHNLLFWRRSAEIVEKYVRKGDKLFVEGELRTRSYTDKQGLTRYITEIWVNNMEMLTPKGQREEAEAAPAVAPQQPAPSQQMPERPTEVPF